MTIAIMELDKGIIMKVSNTLKKAITESLQNKLTVRLEDKKNALNAMQDKLRPLIDESEKRRNKALRGAITSEMQAFLSANPNIVLTKNIADIVCDNIAYRLYTENSSIYYEGKQKLESEIREQMDKLNAAVSDIVIETGAQKDMLNTAVSSVITALELGSQKDTVKDLIDAVTFD